MESKSDQNEWSIQYSKTYQKTYYFNKITGKTSWTIPDALINKEGGSIEANNDENGGDKDSEPPIKKQRRELVSSSALSSSSQHPKVAIIVPFRDLDPKQSRYDHLRVFVPYMTSFLSNTNSNTNFKIFIIEQSNDERKFNRGKLLNIGFDIAKKSGYEVFIFHDVDLLPHPKLLPLYLSIPSSPLHIARLWNRLFFRIELIMFHTQGEEFLVSSPHFLILLSNFYISCMCVCVDIPITPCTLGG